MKPAQQKMLREVLNAFADNPKNHQRQLAETLGVALGAANAHVQYCIKHGFLKKGTGRSGYFLTEKGQMMRCKLLTDTYHDQLFFSRKLLDEYRTLMRDRIKPGTSFIIAGTSDIADLAYLAAIHEHAAVDGFYEPDTFADQHLGLPVIDTLILQPEHVVIIADINQIATRYNSISAQTGRRRVAVPPSLIRLLSSREDVVL